MQSHFVLWIVEWFISVTVLQRNNQLQAPFQTKTDWLSAYIHACTQLFAPIRLVTRFNLLRCFTYVGFIRTKSYLMHACIHSDIIIVPKTELRGIFPLNSHIDSLWELERLSLSLPIFRLHLEMIEFLRLQQILSSILCILGYPNPGLSWLTKACYFSSQLVSYKCPRIPQNFSKLCKGVQICSAMEGEPNSPRIVHCSSQLVRFYLFVNKHKWTSSEQAVSLQCTILGNFVHFPSWEQVASPYVGMVRFQDGSSNQCISVFTAISSPRNYRLKVYWAAYRACPSLQ